jgi:hypothetical protein
MAISIDAYEASAIAQEKRDAETERAARMENDAAHTFYEYEAGIPLARPWKSAPEINCDPELGAFAFNPSRDETLPCPEPIEMADETRPALPPYDADETSRLDACAEGWAKCSTESGQKLARRYQRRARLARGN